MKFLEELKQLMSEKTKVWVNGLGEGTIIAIEDDYIKWSLVTTKEKAEDNTREVIRIPFDKINTVSDIKKINALLQETR